MYPKIVRGLLTFLSLVTLGVSSVASAQQEDPGAVEQPPLGGNQTVSITLPVQTAGMNANYYRVHVDGDGFSWLISNVNYEPGST